MSKVLIVGGEGGATQVALAAVSLIEGTLALAPDIHEARSSLTSGRADLAIIDFLLRPAGDKEVTDFVTACQQASPVVPVLALVPADRLEAYTREILFDDFAPIPCRAPELAARLNVLLRRFKPAEDATRLKIGDLTVDLARYEVTQGGRRMELTFKEYELLKFLATNPGKVFTRETLLNRVWGYDYFGGTRTVDVHIRRLRSKIEVSGTEYIDTVRNVGYRFHSPEH